MRSVQSFRHLLECPAQCMTERRLEWHSNWWAHPHGFGPASAVLLQISSHSNSWTNSRAICAMPFVPTFVRHNLVCASGRSSIRKLCSSMCKTFGNPSTLGNNDPSNRHLFREFSNLDNEFEWMISICWRRNFETDSLTSEICLMWFCKNRSMFRQSSAVPDWFSSNWPRFWIHTPISLPFTQKL